MRITDLAFKEARAGHWHSEDHDVLGLYHRNQTVRSREGQQHTLYPARAKLRVIYHYSTAMLWLGLDEEGKPTGRIWDWNLGHGSVSDQMGCNRIFQAIKANHCYIRKDGARIE